MCTTYGVIKKQHASATIRQKDAHSITYRSEKQVFTKLHVHTICTNKSYIQAIYVTYCYTFIKCLSISVYDIVSFLVMMLFYLLAHDVK